MKSSGQWTPPNLHSKLGTTGPQPASEEIIETTTEETTEAKTMELGLYGLGRMGANMVTRLLRGGHRVVAANHGPGPVDEAKR